MVMLSMPTYRRVSLYHRSASPVLAQNEIQAMQNEIHAHTEKINEQNQESFRSSSDRGGWFEDLIGQTVY